MSGEQDLPDEEHIVCAIMLRQVPVDQSALLNELFSQSLMIPDKPARKFQHLGPVIPEKDSIDIEQPSKPVFFKY